VRHDSDAKLAFDRHCSCRGRDVTSDAFDRHADRLRSLEVWLGENVIASPEEASLALESITVDWNRYPQNLCGEIVVQWKVMTLEPWYFAVNVTGHTDVFPPQFCSPLGVPASYAKYDAPPELLRQLASQVEANLPPIRGLRQEDSGYSIIERVDPAFDLSTWERLMRTGSWRPGASISAEFVPASPGQALSPARASYLQSIALFLVGPVCHLYAACDYPDVSPVRRAGDCR
jgi:hypothetical protein